jgi:hypothetical protein
MRDLRMIGGTMAALLMVSTRASKALLLLAAFLPVGAGAAFAETPADGWSGQLQCAISVRAPGYQDDQTHTWVLSGPPIARSGFRDYPATWTVTGAGNKTATVGPGGAGSWTRTGSDANGSITIFVPGGTTSIRVAPGQRLVTAAGGLRGTLAAAPFSSAADEWRFQYFDTPGASSETHFSGSRTQMLNNPIGWRQPAGAQATETCTWSFAKASGGQPVGLTTVPAPVPSGSPSAAPGGALAGITRGSPLAAGAANRPGLPASSAAGAAGAGGSAAGAAGAAAGAAGSATAGQGSVAGDAASAAGGGAPTAAGAAGPSAGAAGAAAGAAGAKGIPGSAAAGGAPAAGAAGSAAGAASSAAVGAAAPTAGSSAAGAGGAPGSAAGSNASGGGSAAPTAASAVTTVDAAVAPSGPVPLTAAFSGPTSLTIVTPGTYQLVVTIPKPQTTVVTENQPASTTSTPTTQTVTNVSVTTRTSTAFVIDSGEAIFNATIYQYNMIVEKQSATVVLSPTTVSPPPAVATFKFPTPGTRSVSVVASVVAERHDATQRTVTTRTTTHDSTCNCSDRTNTSTNSEPEQTQVSKTLYMIGAPPAAPATLQVVVP